MYRFQDISGTKFNRLTAVKRTGTSNGGNAIWIFKCDCGAEKEIDSSLVKRGHIKSCGCMRKELMRSQKNGYKHGMAGTAIYKAWVDAYSRCRDKNHQGYRNYGGRGIKFSEEFLGENGLERFSNELGQKPSKSHSVDRIDNERGYEPGNLRWATKREQRRNQRSRKCNT